MTRRTDYYNGDKMPQRWAALNGLRYYQRGWQSDSALLHLIDGRRDALVEKVNSYSNLGHPVFDHPRFFTKPGSASAVAVVTAPYLGVVLRTFGTTATLNAKVHAIAADLGLYVRVGHPADTIYLSPHPDEPTIPIVWWNPDRVSIDIPEIEDPYPRFAEDA